MVRKDVLERWLKLELGSVHDGLVQAPLPLETLLEMDEPVAKTRSGDPHRFDVDALARFAAALSDDVRGKVKLPVTVYLDREAMGNCYVQDRWAIRALAELDEVDRDPRDGKLWMGTPLARDLARRYPSLIQFVMT